MPLIILNIILVLAIIYFVPFFIYGLFTTAGKIQVPQGVSPSKLLLSFFISKVGTVIAFVLIFYFGHKMLVDNVFIYAFLWWLMFVFNEISQAIGINYSLNEALAGVISETIYFPLSALVTTWVLG